ncbi:hypothetical protein R3W88_021050 [Solanum pinnatisectum]|uniref:Uncharacterized protein n=1 Tax=Solanum pinnatisectum TaxID=50273 RepID=A0AAV9LQP5_9SOLN|nr:hypothetical protein R3W88_021050 [Solanum pinnatisectum]
MFNNFKTMCTWKSSIDTHTKQAKKARGSLKSDSLHTGGAKTVGTIAQEMNWDALLLNRRFSRRLMSGRKKMSQIRMCGWRKGPNELLFGKKKW